MHLPKHRKILFIHIQRTGGTTIRNLLSQYKHPVHVILSGHKRLIDFQEEREDISEFFTFSFVRNPWDRIASWHKLLGMNNPLADPNMSEFLEELVEENKQTNQSPFFLNQLDYLSGANQEIKVDQIGRYERYEEELIRIFELLSMPVFDVPKLNETKKDDYRTYYDDNSAERVAQLCKRDIEEFGYQF